MNADEMLAAVHELRLLVFVECVPEECSSEVHPDVRHFHQVKLNEEQFKRVSDATCVSARKDSALKDGYEICEQIVSDECYEGELFDGLNSIEEDQGGERGRNGAAQKGRGKKGV